MPTTLTRRTALRLIGGGTTVGLIATGPATATHNTWTARLRGIGRGGGHGAAEFKRNADHDDMGFGLELAGIDADNVSLDDPALDDISSRLVVTRTNNFVKLDKNTENAVLRGEDKLAYIAEGSFTTPDISGSDDVDTLDELVDEMDKENTSVFITSRRQWAALGTVSPGGQ